MEEAVAIIGGGVSGLTCGVLLAERGYRAAILAKEVGQQTTSATAAAVWYPYDVEPADKVIAWALETYNALIDLGRKPGTGVSMIELRQFSRAGKIQIPDWAMPLGARPLPSFVVPGGREESLTVPQSEFAPAFKSGFALTVPLMDTTIYLDYLGSRFLAAGGSITANVSFEKLEDAGQEFVHVINCAGLGARELVRDIDLEPHRGQVAIVPKVAGLSCAVVCDDAPLMYAIPRMNDCVFGGTNEITADLGIDSASTLRILDECSRVLKIKKPNVLAERVGLRPFRTSGVRLERGRLDDGRTVIHNYGHGGAGFTLSWGCAGEVVDLAMS
jgi:D-amino-acid oxidase